MPRVSVTPSLLSALLFATTSLASISSPIKRDVAAFSPVCHPVVTRPALSNPHPLRGPTSCPPPLAVGKSLGGARVGSRQAMCGGAVRRAGRRQGQRGWTCLYVDPPGDGDEDGAWELTEDDYEDHKFVMLRDTAMDRTIECFIDRELDVNGKPYATLIPADTPVILAEYNTTESGTELVPILDDDKIDVLFDTASAVLAEVDLMLSRSAVVLTVEGGMLDDEEEGMLFELSDDDDGEGEGGGGGGDMFTSSGTVSLKIDELVDLSRPHGDRDNNHLLLHSDEDDEDDSENEKVQVLATFFFEGRQHVVAAPMEPVLIIGAPADTPADSIQHLSDELDKVLVGGFKTPPGAEGGDAGAGGDEADPREGPEVEEYLLPGKEELERITPMIEQQLETLYESDMDERRRLMSLRASLQRQWSGD